MVNSLNPKTPASVFLEENGGPVSTLPYSSPLSSCDTLGAAEPRSDSSRLPFPSHQLEPPKISPDQMKDFNDLLNEINSIIPNREGEKKAVSNKEAVLWKSFITCMKDQQEIQEENSKLAMLIMEKIQEENRTIQKEHFSILDEKISQSKVSKILNWISWGLWGAIAVSGVAGVVTIATGGAGLPAVIACFQSAAQAAQGGTEATKAILNYLNDIKTGELKLLEMKREINNEHIKEEIKCVEQTVQAIADILEKMIETANNQYAASINR